MPPLVCFVDSNLTCHSLQRYTVVWLLLDAQWQLAFNACRWGNRPSDKAPISYSRSRGYTCPLSASPYVHMRMTQFSASGGKSNLHTVSHTNRRQKSNVHTDSKTGLTTSWLAQNLSAASAKNDRLGMRKHSRDGEASRALDVHEKRVRALNQTLELVAPLLLLARRVDKINCESLRCQLMSSSTYHSLHSQELGEKSQMWRPQSPPFLAP